MMFRVIVVFLLGLCWTTSWSQGKQQSGKAIRESIVFKNGESGYKCFRIPAIVTAPNGDLLAFAEGRRNNCSDFGDVDIVLKRSRNNGVSWDALQLVVDFDTMQAGNPAPVFDLTDPRFPKGRLYLFYNTGITSEGNVRNGKAIREIWYKASTDGGSTWSEAVNITTSVSRPNKPEVNPLYAFPEDWRSYATTPGHALQIRKGPHAGRIFVAANHSEGPPQPAFREYRAHGFYSDDHGQSWKLAPNISYPGGNESMAAELPGGGLILNIRNQSGDAKYRLLAFSSSAGEKWDTLVVATALPDPVCQGSIVNYTTPSGKNALLVSNLDSQTKREKLTIRISYDNGKTWTPGKLIYAGSAAYSDLAIQRNKQVGVLYERENYTEIVYCSMPYKWLGEQP